MGETLDHGENYMAASHFFLWHGSCVRMFKFHLKIILHRRFFKSNSKMLTHDPCHKKKWEAAIYLSPLVQCPAYSSCQLMLAIKLLFVTTSAMKKVSSKCTSYFCLPNHRSICFAIISLLKKGLWLFSTKFIPTYLPPGPVWKRWKRGCRNMLESQGLDSGPWWERSRDHPDMISSVFSAQALLNNVLAEKGQKREIST